MGLATPRSPADLFHPDALPELDPGERRIDWNGDAVCRPRRACRSPSDQAGGDRPSLAALGRQGGQPGRHRHPPRCDGNSLPDQRAQRADHLRSALRCAGGDDGLPSRRGPRSLPQEPTRASGRSRQIP